MIELQSVSFRYGEDLPLALDSVDLSIRAGEFVGVVGATGSGKSSLAYAIRGMIPSFFEDGEMSGRVIAAGYNVTESDAQFSADKLGMVFQDAASQAFGSTVLLDAAFGPVNLGLPRETVVERVRRYLDRVRLRSKIDQSPATLSGGETQRLAIAGVLATEPDLLILDEPVAELDPHGRKEVCDVLDELRATRGVTVVLIEQDPDLIARYADRVVVMDAGRIAMVGTPREVFGDAEACLRLGVYPPETAALAQRLPLPAAAGTPLTAGELEELVGPLLTGDAKWEESPGRSDEAIDEVLALRGVSHRYPNGFEALRDVDLSIGSREYVAIVGTNGAGKTTLTKHFNGIRRPTAGVVVVAGADIADTSTPDLAMKIGYCFQNPDHQIFSSTVREEVEYGLKCQGIEEAARGPRVDRILEVFELSEFADTNPLNLGKGQRQKVALASILVLEPEVLVIDEPTTGLDWQECQQILDIIDEFHAAGTTVVAVTHDMRLVRERAQRVVAMSHGRIAYDGPSADFFFQDEVLREADIERTPLSEIATFVAERLGVPPAVLPRTVDGMAGVLEALIER
ncbi:ABC transporter ATP-binding protein [Microbacterium sp. RD1]|uniref:ABC transporter ATP-binding protein n=1 Tax=Microbacterium sp. RD1 TaxID=3457313 RepID=UPI003FA5F772